MMDLETKLFLFVGMPDSEWRYKKCIPSLYAEVGLRSEKHDRICGGDFDIVPCFCIQLIREYLNHRSDPTHCL